MITFPRNQPQLYRLAFKDLVIIPTSFCEANLDMTSSFTSHWPTPVCFHSHAKNPSIHLHEAFFRRRFTLVGCRSAFLSFHVLLRRLSSLDKATLLANLYGALSALEKSGNYRKQQQFNEDSAGDLMRIKNINN